jgi:NADP-dependent 3-hydroxy acid dehydrogenase YdfG
MQEVAIVTGHSSGLGRSFTEALLTFGMPVVGVSRRSMVKPIKESLIEVIGSVGNQETVEKAFNEAARIGKLKLVINCAGQGVFGPVGSYSIDDIRKALEGNFIGLIAFTDRAISSMKLHGGDIVNVMSTASKRLRVAESVYTGVKWGAKAYTRTVRDAVKAEKLPIRIIEVYPCGMKTRFWAEAVRPITDGVAFPDPNPIANTVLVSLRNRADSYQQEFTFERS